MKSIHKQTPRPRLPKPRPNYGALAVEYLTPDFTAAADLNISLSSIDTPTISIEDWFSITSPANSGSSHDIVMSELNTDGIDDDASFWNSR